MQMTDRDLMKRISTTDGGQVTDDAKRLSLKARASLRQSTDSIASNKNSGYASIYTHTQLYVNKSTITAKSITFFQY